MPVELFCQSLSRTHRPKKRLLNDLAIFDWSPLALGDGWFLKFFRHTWWHTFTIGFSCFRCSVTLHINQCSSAHSTQFLIAADWFVFNQDEAGGWSVPVERSIADKKLVLAPGWHSAMAQGHAISVLVRAHGRTAEQKCVGLMAVLAFVNQTATGSNPTYASSESTLCVEKWNTFLQLRGRIELLSVLLWE